MKDLIELNSLYYGNKNFQPLGIEIFEDPISAKINPFWEISEWLGNTMLLRGLPEKRFNMVLPWWE